MATPIGKISALWKARALFAHPAKLIRVLRDKRTPTLARVIPLLAFIYVFFPLDILPDFIPILGQIDDISIVIYALSYALSLVPDEVFRSVGLDMKAKTRS